MRVAVCAAGKELEKVPLTIAFTMSVSDWRAFRAKLVDRSWPVWEVDALICSAMDEVEKSVKRVVDGNVEVEV